MKKTSFVFAFLMSLLLLSCDSGQQPLRTETSSDRANLKDMMHNAQNDLVDREALVEEVLHTDKYSYLNVKENGQNLWIAVPRTDINPGEMCYFKGGIVQENFKSKQFDRVFESLLLVSNFSKEPLHVNQTPRVNQSPSTQKKKEPPITEVQNIEPAEGAIKISELIANKEQYSGKAVKVTAQCVKVNNNIMGRNWVHLKDGSADSYDFTITTNETIQKGAVVTLEGTIVLNKDFGAGYKYDIIMEAAKLH